MATADIVAPMATAPKESAIALAATSPAASDDGIHDFDSTLVEQKAPAEIQTPPPTDGSVGSAGSTTGRRASESGSIRSIEGQTVPQEGVVDDDSELSDEDDEEIEPDHYYDGGKIPVFKPFRSFKKFISKIDKYGMRSGIVKVVPPKEWLDSLPALDEAVKTIRIKNPITQEFGGAHGTYTQANIEKQRSYNLPQWKALTEESQHQPPAKRGERRKNVEIKAPRTRAPNGAPAAAAAAQAALSEAAGGRARATRRAPPSIETANSDVDEAQAPPTPTSPAAEPDSEPPKKVARRQSGATAKRGPSRTGAKPGPKPGPKPKGSQPKSVAERRKYNRAETSNLVDEAAFKGFDYRFHEKDEYTRERCAELEEKYWKSLNFAPPMYGGDMPGSLFDESTTSWNVAKLENLLDVLGQKIPGVNTTYLYLGMWKATFAWHLEDVDLYSINYIHFGAPKQWYSISQADARRFESAMKSIWPQDAKSCGQFLRHKTYLISPDLLQKQFNITVNRLVHNEGEFVITFPYGYHSGYNLGYNCAESVNFATESWLDFGRIAKKCGCEADSVWVDVGEVERKLRGEPTPEYEEFTDDDEDMDDVENHVPSPPASVKGRKGAARKRKRNDPAQGKKMIKKLKLRIRTAAFQPCVLCPHQLPGEPLVRTETGKQAHLCCASYTPETYIETNDMGVSIVRGLGAIDKARLDLKCNYCRSKTGACFQCSSRKCIRAYHASCAAAAGVQADFGAMAVWGDDGTEYSTEGYDFRCKFHRAKRPKHTTPDTLEANAFVRKQASLLEPGQRAQLQYVGGDIFAGTVVENRRGERTAVVDVLPDGDRVEVEYRYVLALDPADSQRLKPSPEALPLPEHLSKHIAPDSNPQFGPPQDGDVFCDGAEAGAVYKWCEFTTGPHPHNRDHKDIELDASNVLWHYLGRPSTDARSNWTHDPAIRKNNPASNFLDTVRPPPPAPMQRLPPMPSSSMALPGTALAQHRQANWQAIEAITKRLANGQPSGTNLPAGLSSNYRPIGLPLPSAPVQPKAASPVDRFSKNVARSLGSGPYAKTPDRVDPTVRPASSPNTPGIDQTPYPIQPGTYRPPSPTLRDLDMFWQSKPRFPPSNPLEPADRYEQRLRRYPHLHQGLEPAGHAAAAYSSPYVANPERYSGEYRAYLASLGAGAATNDACEN